MTPLLEAASAYRALGWRMVPVPHRAKAPTLKGWPTFDPGEDLERHFATGNVGVMLGAVSGGLVDVDLDTPEAVELAPRFLPETWTFGRPSKPSSHWLYLVPGSMETRRFLDVPLREGTPATLLELRAGRAGDRTVQTVFPPSTHPSGEPVRWSDRNDGQEAPRVVPADELAENLEGLAVATLLRRHVAREQVDAWMERGGFPDAPVPVLEQARTFVGSRAPSPRLTARTTRPSSTFEEAVARYNLDNARELPRHGATCPVCGHHECFGRSKDNPSRWSCFSASHRGAGLEGELCWHGDFLDLDAHRAGVSRGDLLRERGYIGGAQ